MKGESLSARIDALLEARAALLEVGELEAERAFSVPNVKWSTGTARRRPVGDKS